MADCSNYLCVDYNFYFLFPCLVMQCAYPDVLMPKRFLVSSYMYVVGYIIAENVLK